MATTQPPTKKQKAPSPLLDLDEDALRAILLRTTASDHLNLRRTCRRIQNILDSDVFVRERCESGYAESALRLARYGHYSLDRDDESVSSTESRFVECYGFTDIEGRIMVDGKEAGSMRIRLIPRDNRYRRGGGFHEMCDAVSQDTQEIGLTFFNDRGKPRLSSIKEALGNEKNVGTVQVKPLLYIDPFKLKPAYRTTSTVGAQALRSLLLDSTALKDRWSIAFYIPESRSRFTEEDEKLQRKIESVWIPTEEQLQEKKEWEVRRKALKIQDMHPFLRAGFVQDKETVVKANCFFLFAVPSFLEASMMSHEETLSIAITEKPKPPPEPSAEAQKLLETMKSFCTERNDVTKLLKSWRLPVAENPNMIRMKQELEKSIEAFRTFMNRGLEIPEARKEEIAGLFRLAQQEGTPISEKEKALQDLRPILSRFVLRLGDNVEAFNVAELQCLYDNTDRLMEKISQGLTSKEEKLANLEDDFPRKVEEEINRLDQEIRDLDARVHSELSKIVEEGYYDTLVSSDSIHCCAANLLPLYVELLIDLLPNEKKREVINKLDRNGRTPLMVAAQTGNEELRLQTCKQLLRLGADKNIVDGSGLSALGVFRESQRSMTDFARTTGLFSMMLDGIHAAADAAPSMEALLMPENGPTEADDAKLEDEDDDDDSVDAFESDEEEEDGVVAAGAGDGENGDAED